MKIKSNGGNINLVQNYHKLIQTPKDFNQTYGRTEVSVCKIKYVLKLLQRKLDLTVQGYTIPKGTTIFANLVKVNN